MNKIDRASVPLIELKLAAPGQAAGEMAFSGYGAVFNNLDAYGDVIMPGAFAANLSAIKSGPFPWPAMLLQHGGWGMAADDMNPVGIWTELSEDGTGLKVEGKLADTPRGRDLYALMKMEPRPAITGLSIGYIAKEWEPRSKPDEPRRKLKRLDLMEISLVTFPANPKARVESIKSIRQVERILRDGGLSERETKTILSQAAMAIAFRDGEDETMEALAALVEYNISLWKGAKHGQD